MTLTVVLGGCATTPRGAGNASGVPEDFWLSVTVMNESDGDLQPMCERPVKYLIESDRVLRATSGTGVSEYAPTTMLRHLSTEHVREVYNALVSSGVNEHGTNVSVAPRRNELGDRRLVVVSSRQDGRRRTVVIDQTAGVDAGACGLVEVLNRLAWRVAGD